MCPPVSSCTLGMHAAPVLLCQHRHHLALAALTARLAVCSRGHRTYLCGRLVKGL